MAWKPTQYPFPVSQAIVAPPESSAQAFDKRIRQKYTATDSKIHNFISRSRFPNREIEQHCRSYVGRLRVYKTLFVHTFVYLASCGGGYLSGLMASANAWGQWSSVDQLTHHSSIKHELSKFWQGQSKSPLNDGSVQKDDDSDLLCHLLYCCRKPELYELTRPAYSSSRASEQVIELLWNFLQKDQEADVARRLRSHIYRMTRKSAYLPRALQLHHNSFSHGQPLGNGAHGVVTKAKMGGRDIVIKRILCSDAASKRKCLELFAGEAMLWSTLRHRYIVPFIGVVTEGTVDMGLVSQYCKNGNIRGYMTGYKPKDWPALAKGWGKDLAEALEYIHSHEPPIIHGDIKGDNVLVSDGGHALLGDFGLSYASDSGKYLDSGRVGRAINPIHWMAPEIMRGEHTKASEKSDMYALGCVMYEMLSGKIPFEGRSSNQVVQFVLNGERPRRPDTIREDDRVWQIVLWCWNARPEHRPQATELIEKTGSRWAFW